ncbi:hypothetical protein DV702_16045 [Sporosarcina sp. PTS2304]|uniref:hypothetical protein n=1 Tax=Sporosarcina sp. PTS2304 TaxID=2283194 RepID=UPI000E0D358F|nr:hypothetical protein [Sporosarcina sp. PTS2304]AXI01096.1 hypothetical protein DV702_16045 [Sporosarcina sp. PTS2304]
MKNIVTVLFLSFILIFSLVIETKEASAAGVCAVKTYDDLISPNYIKYTNLTYTDFTYKNGFTSSLSNGKQVYSTARQMLGFSALRYTYTYYTY